MPFGREMNRMIDASRKKRNEEHLRDEEKNSQEKTVERPKYTGFNEIPSDTGANWYILYRKAKRVDSPIFLEEVGLRPLSYVEALTTLMKDNKLNNFVVSAKEHFHVTGKIPDGFKVGDLTILKEGRLVKEADPEYGKNTIQLAPGPYQMSLIAIPYEPICSYAYLLDSSYPKEDSLHMVIGVPKEIKYLERK